MAGKKFVFDPTTTEEYDLKDLTVTAVRITDGARFPFRKGELGLLEDVMYDDKPESKTMQGSGSNPRAHSRTLNKPTSELTMPVDCAASFKKFCGREGKVNLLCSRKTPTGPTVTDVVVAWKPLFAGPTFKNGDIATRKVSGNVLRIDEDVRGMLA